MGWRGHLIFTFRFQTVIQAPENYPLNAIFNASIQLRSQSIQLYRTVKTSLVEFWNPHCDRKARPVLTEKDILDISELDEVN